MWGFLNQLDFLSTPDFKILFILVFCLYSRDFLDFDIDLCMNYRPTKIHSSWIDLEALHFQAKDSYGDQIILSRLNLRRNQVLLVPILDSWVHIGFFLYALETTVDKK